MHRDGLPRQMNNHHVGVLVFVETHRRVLKGEFGSIPKPLSEDAFSMGGYCIDAPSEIPSGSMRSETVLVDKDDVMIVPSMNSTWRDGEDA